MLKISKRKCELKDFVDLKKRFPCNFLRTVAKHVGLGLLFYCQARTLATMLREGGISESDIDKIITVLGLEDETREAIRTWERKQQTGRIEVDRGGPIRNKPISLNDKTDVKFLVVAEKLHKLFYSNYPGLMERCEREHRFIMEYVVDPVTKKRRRRGYARSWGGPIRHFPEIRYMTINAEGQLMGADKVMYSKIFSGMKNQASNTAIQTLEVYHTAPVVSCASHNFKKNDMKSRIWNFVHDSQDLYVYKPERELVLAMYETMMHAYDGSGHGIPMEMEGDVADITGGKRGSGKDQHYYSHGDEVKLKGRDMKTEAEKAGIEFEYEDTIPR